MPNERFILRMDGNKEELIGIEIVAGFVVNDYWSLIDFNQTIRVLNPSLYLSLCCVYDVFTDDMVMDGSKRRFQGRPALWGYGAK